MFSEDLQCLKKIGIMGGCRGPVWVSSQRLAASLETSPQTASRRLKSLEEQMAITRFMRPDGQQIAITRLGEDILHREFTEYCSIFERLGREFVMSGVVISGLGEGRYYMSLDHYRTQFADALGFIPYAGTLNIRLTLASVEIRKKLDALKWTRIQGFTSENRTFGDAKSLPCRIGDIACGIVVPGRSHYPEDIIEIIAPVELRRVLGLTDGDSISVEVIL